MRPDVSILGYDLRASGVVRNALRIAGAAAAAGLVTELWTARDDGPLRSEIPVGVTLRSAGHSSMKLGRTVDLARAVPALSSYLKAVRPRIALSSGNHMHFAAELAHALAGRPTDVRLWARASNATLKHPIGAYLGHDLPRTLAIGVDTLNALQYRGFDHVIAVCHELGEHLTRELGIAPSRLRVIANGVSIGTIRDRASEPLDHPWMQSGQPPVIVSAGRFSKQKNFADLLRALAVVRAHVPARLVLLGEGSAAQRNALEALAARLGLAESVLLAGYDPNPWRWMRRAAVFAVSSRWEGSSNVVLEALACGTPVVAYRCPTGIAEVVEPLGDNLVVAPGDSTALAAAILRRIAEPRNGADQEAQAEKFDLSHMLDAYVALFVRALRN
jgi:glycosyltransferase involved in cell wall biosynthesis